MELTAKDFAAFAGEVRRLRNAIKPTFLFFGGIKIAGGSGWGRPSFTDRLVDFNGRPGFENFLIYRIYSEKYKNYGPKEDGLYWDFVKTNQAPYDILVTAALLSLRHHFVEVVLASDGALVDWAPGIELYERVTCRKAVTDFLAA